jgi:hypothetical protein
MKSKYSRESKYARVISKEYFKLLKRYNYNPSLANNKQIELAEKLSKKYDIHEGNILRLIMYAGIAWSYATDSEIEFFYSDMTEIADFEKEPVPIDKIIFRGSSKSLGSSKSFEITNPYLIDKLYYSMLDFMDFQNVLKKRRSDTKKKRPSAKIVKLIATEIYNELTKVEKISEWKSYCIIGYIFCLYNIGLKTKEPILSEEKYNLLQKEKRKVTETYLQYLATRIKRYINS